MPTRKKSHPADPPERADKDRRQEDLGPPQGWRERRRSVERRMPEVQEDAISRSEWDRHYAVYMANHAAAVVSETPAADPDDAAAPEPEAQPVPAPKGRKS